MGWDFPTKQISRAAAFFVGAMVIAPLSAEAFMRTASEEELAQLEPVEDSGYTEHYESPDIANYGFTRIYIAPVENAMEPYEIYDRRLRPEYIDDLALEFHGELVAALEPSGLLTDTPDEDTLIIRTALTEVQEYHAFSTGTNMADSFPGRRNRGGAVMEMRWFVGEGGPMVLALRDGRQPHPDDTLIDADDNFTDTRMVFGIWAEDLAGFFGASEAEADMTN